MRAFVQKPNQSQQQHFSQARTRDLPARSSLNVTSPLAHNSVPAIVDEVLQSPGTALDEQTRANMEPRFGYDFSNVRVHTNERAAESARAVRALAYTVGNHVVFAAGQHAPFSYGGQKLLAHELAHVVQQHGGPPVLARAPDDPGGKRIPLGVPQEMIDEEQKKKAAKQKHEDEQRIVIDLMDKARKIQPDPKKDFRDPDNLLRNSVEMFDRGRFRLTVLSPTHYSDQLHFDTRVRHPKIGGDYPTTPPKDPKNPGPGLMNDTSLGKFVPFQSASTATIGGIQTMPPKVEVAPGQPAPKAAPPPPPPTLSTAPPKFSSANPGDIFLFTRNSDVASEFRQIFVHESQHVADLSTQLDTATAGSLDEKMEGYKSEFRAFWIQPTFARTSLLDPGGTRFVDPKGKATNSKQVTITADKQCSVCPRNDPGKGFVESKTDFKNPRQEEIFWHIVAAYPNHGYDCCYVFNKSFHDEVNRFAIPESVNLINSERLMKLNLEVQKLNNSMTKAEVEGTNLVVLLSQLEPLDWIFLSKLDLSKPFWDSLKAAAPEFVTKGVKALLKKGSKESLSWAEIKTALSITK